jgi:hypothetical protein
MLGGQVGFEFIAVKVQLDVVPRAAQAHSIPSCLQVQV